MLLDAGALIALDGNDRAMWVRLEVLHDAGELPVTHGGVIGQVWRGGPGQARLAMALAGVEVRPLDDRLGRAAGELMGEARTSDVVDAALVLLAGDGDEIVTLDRADIEILPGAARRHVELVRPRERRLWTPDRRFGVTPRQGEACSRWRRSELDQQVE
jgi:hypothetical protein